MPIGAIRVERGQRFELIDRARFFAERREEAGQRLARLGEPGRELRGGFE